MNKSCNYTKVSKTEGYHNFSCAIEKSIYSNMGKLPATNAVGGLRDHGKRAKLFFS